MMYEAVHGAHRLALAAPWVGVGKYAQPAAWARRQTVPGAVIPPQSSTIGAPGPRSRNVYELVIDISAKTAAGGWAIGERVTYRAGSQTFTTSGYTGYAIAAPDSSASLCNARMSVIEHAWGRHI